jgi:hypothetical protein
MDDFPLQMVLFGLADRCLEPFCYGCAGFVISYRFSKTVPAKILAIVITALFFLWMDDIWPAIGSRAAKMGIASGNRAVAEMFQDKRRLGQAEYSTGEQSGLWDIFDLDAWDVGSAALFVPLAFQLGLFFTRRRWNEFPLQTVVPPPPPPVSRFAPPPPPQTQRM